MTIPDVPNQKAIDSASARILRGELDISGFQRAVGGSPMSTTCTRCGTIYGFGLICHVCNPGGGDMPSDRPLQVGERVLVMWRWNPAPGEHYLRAEGYATLIERSPLKPTIAPDIESWYVRLDGTDQLVLRSVYARDRVAAGGEPLDNNRPMA